MKTKILRYSIQKINQVVTDYVELEKVCDNVYTYLYKKDQHREEDDLIAIVLQIENVYFQEGIYNRCFLKAQDLAEIGPAFVAIFHKMIEGIIQRGEFLQILYVRIYEELGRDIAPLLQYRENRELKLEQQKEERLRKKELADRQAAAREKERLQTKRDKFIAGGSIEADDFIALCKQEKIKIPLRTHGTLNRSVMEIFHTSIRFQSLKGKRAPKLDGCFALVKTLKQKLEM